MPTERPPANLLQAQRGFFGAYTYHWRDRGGESFISDTADFAFFSRRRIFLPGDCGDPVGDGGADASVGIFPSAGGSVTPDEESKVIHVPLHLIGLSGQFL
ncbi:hypothetical protein D4R89_00715 [bacterium]|nr:MAG: hypothetical protein D4R89_00715 [bacterium]